jgi:sugar phosphate isomerase/epimerase
MKFALLSVSYTGLFHAAKPLSIEEQVYKAKQLGFDGLAIETKRPVACPLDVSKSDRARIKAVAADQGISARSRACRTSQAATWRSARTTSR